MALSDLPTLYDLSTPASNLAAFEESLSALSFDLDPYRITWGQGIIPAALGVAFGYEQKGALGAVLGAVAGYMAPLPLALFILAKAASGSIDRHALAGYSPRRRSRRR